MLLHQIKNGFFFFWAKSIPGKATFQCGHGDFDKSQSFPTKFEGKGSVSRMKTTFARFCPLKIFPKKNPGKQHETQRIQKSIGTSSQISGWEENHPKNGKRRGSTRVKRSSSRGKQPGMNQPLKHGRNRFFFFWDQRIQSASTHHTAPVCPL